ncbi:MAG: hypothetical protein PHS99_00590 [Candidatus Marinimicrobia bacterium]|nr:hypothetical protein [Candidatus Neomarinimicrobiota bacterium]
MCVFLIFWLSLKPTRKAYQTERYMLSYKEVIDSICHYFSLSPEVYFSVIYAERLHNINNLDKADYSRAYMGFNASVGFAQLKISTSEWIESHYSHLLPFNPSKNRSALIRRLAYPDTNIVYSAVYCQIIKDEFKEQFGYYPDVATIASYYGCGIDYGKGLNNEFYLNELGLTAYEYYTKTFKTNQ